MSDTSSNYRRYLDPRVLARVEALSCYGWIIERAIEVGETGVSPRNHPASGDGLEVIGE